MGTLILRKGEVNPHTDREMGERGWGGGWQFEGRVRKWKGKIVGGKIVEGMKENRKWMKSKIII